MARSRAMQQLQWWTSGKCWETGTDQLLSVLQQTSIPSSSSGAYAPDALQPIG